MRTVRLVLRWTIRFRPINGVGKESSAILVDSTAPMANRAIRADGEEFTLAIEVDLESLHDFSSACRLTTRDNGQITPLIRQLFGSFVTGIRYVR